MSVYKQPHSPYWLIELQVGARRFRRSSKTTSKREAQRRERQWRDELTARPSSAELPTVTLAEALDRYMTAVMLRRRRIGAAERETYLHQRILRDLGAETALPALTSSRIARFSDGLLKEGKAPG